MTTDLPLQPRQPSRPHQIPLLIAQQLIWQVQPLLQLPLVVRRLRAAAEQVAHAQLEHFAAQIAEGAVLRRAAAGAGDGVPGIRDGLVGGGGSGVLEEVLDGGWNARSEPGVVYAEEDGQAGEGRQVDVGA